MTLPHHFWLGDGLSSVYYSQNKIIKLNKQKNGKQISVWTDDSLE